MQHAGEVSRGTATRGSNFYLLSAHVAVGGRIGERLVPPEAVSSGRSAASGACALHRRSVPLFVQVIDLTGVDIRSGLTKPTHLTVFSTV